jgi:DNA-binding XRE family transcriptional regulator
MTVGKAILRIRQERGMTQDEVGKSARLAPSYLSRIENEHVHPTTATLARLAKALRVKPSDIFHADERGPQSFRHRCPVSTSGQCIGEQIRSVHGRKPTRGKAHYGRRDLELLRMADYVILHGSAEVRRALGVVLESMVQRKR